MNSRVVGIVALVGVALGGALWLGSPWTQPAAANDRLAAVVEGAVRPLLAAHDVAGIAVGVAVRGEARFFCFGVAAPDSGAAVTPDTLFEVGSVSKTYAATLAAFAEGDGRLSFADHPGRFVPALAGTAIDAATLLHLGTYTAGGMPLQFPDEVGDQAAMLAWFRQWRATSAPGERRAYSNPSVGLFAHCAAQALGGDYHDLVEGLLLPGLGLQDTYVRVPATAMARYAWGRDRAGKQKRMQPSVLADETYGVRTTAADLLRFVAANLRPERLAPAWRAAIERTHQGHFAMGTMVQGLGWEQYPFPCALEILLAGNAAATSDEPTAVGPVAGPMPGPRLLQKTGSTNGFGAYVAFVPERDLGVVFLANRNVPIPVRVTAVHAVLTALAGAAAN